METLASFFRVYEVINHEVLTKLRVQTRTSIALIIYGTTRAWRVENLVAHGITDKSSLPKRSNNITLVISFLIAHFLTQSITREYITLALIPVMMQFAFKLASNHLWKWID